jgi:hypothetical protein
MIEGKKGVPKAGIETATGRIASPLLYQMGSSLWGDSRV